MRSEKEITGAIDRYADTVKRICLIHLKNEADTEDVFQNVFMKYCTSAPAFVSPEHEKAWIIRVTINECRDTLKNFFRSHFVSLDTIVEQACPDSEEHSEVLEAVLKLPEQYRRAIYLHYYEGYSAPEIGEILGRNVNTVYTTLTRARKMLKDELGGEDDE